jgi:hypothetical protein
MPYISRPESGISVVQESVLLQNPERCLPECSNFFDASGSHVHCSVEYNSMILTGVFYAASTFGTYLLSTVFK